MKKNTTIILFLIAVTCGSVVAQRTDFIRDRNFEGGLYAKTAWVGGGNATLIALPMVYSMAYTEDLSFDAVTIPAFAFSSPSNSSVLRLSNTKLRATYVWNNILIATFGAKVPTGLNGFDESQLGTAGSIATRQLGFRNANLFNTCDIIAGVSSSLPFKDAGPGDLSLGLGLSYLYKIPYQPVAGADVWFSPASEFNISLAGEYVFLAAARQITLLADLGFTVYGADEYGETDPVEVGAKFNWALFGATEMVPGLPASVRLANYKKGANTQGRIGETNKEASDLIITLKHGLPLLINSAPYGMLSLGTYSGGGNNFGDALVTTIGGGVSPRLSEHLFANGEVGIDLGELGGDFVFGMEVYGKIQYKF